jgi:hypothetical protein
MDAEPTMRRWFQVRLSTILIVTTIAAWWMACPPWREPEPPYMVGSKGCGPRPAPNLHQLAPIAALLAFGTFKGSATRADWSIERRREILGALFVLGCCIVVCSLTALGLFELFGRD